MIEQHEDVAYKAFSKDAQELIAKKQAIFNHYNNGPRKNAFKELQKETKELMSSHLEEATLKQELTKIVKSKIYPGPQDITQKIKREEVSNIVDILLTFNPQVKKTLLHIEIKIKNLNIPFQVILLGAPPSDKNMMLKHIKIRTLEKFVEQSQITLDDIAEANHAGLDANNIMLLANTQDLNALLLTMNKNMREHMKTSKKLQDALKGTNITYFMGHKNFNAVTDFKNNINVHLSKMNLSEMEGESTSVFLPSSESKNSPYSEYKRRMELAKKDYNTYKEALEKLEVLKSKLILLEQKFGEQRTLRNEIKQQEAIKTKLRQEQLKKQAEATEAIQQKRGEQAAPAPEQAAPEQHMFLNIQLIQQRISLLQPHNQEYWEEYFSWQRPRILCAIQQGIPLQQIHAQLWDEYCRWRQYISPPIQHGMHLQQQFLQHQFLPQQEQFLPQQQQPRL